MFVPLVIGLFISSPSFAKMKQPDFTNVTYIRNYDADTVTFDIKGLPPLFGSNISVRVGGIDTPEIRTKNKCEKGLAIQGKLFVAGQLGSAKKITLRNPQRGKYFRIVADIHYDGKDLKTELLKRSLGYPYDGGTKMKVNWCKAPNLAH
jgi:micrococcal nuclease